MVGMFSWSRLPVGRYVDVGVGGQAVLVGAGVVEHVLVVGAAPALLLRLAPSAAPGRRYDHVTENDRTNSY